MSKAGQFESGIALIYKDKSVNLKSIMGVMPLGVTQGSEVTIKVDGSDEESALQALKELMNEGLGK